MSKYWPALQILNQTAAELGLPTAATIVGNISVQSAQLLAMMNSAGNELLLYYPWEQFSKEWVFDTVVGTGAYDLPDDWSYARDQTQWDRTNHWPLVGPKSPQEWAWLKGGLLATAPRLRYRIMNNQLMLWPVPAAGSSPAAYTIAQEYVSKNWVIQNSTTPADMVVSDADEVLYDPWLVSKYVKLKFYELKGLNTAGVQSDFQRIFDTLTGKDVGAPILNLAPRPANQYLGPWSVPDGSWAVGQP